VLKFERFGLGIIKGMTVTIKHLFRHPTVSQYPEQCLNISRRTRGNELIWSRERCTGCATCAKACPQGAIEIVTATNCIQCGLCVEACPYDALFLGYSYERAKYRRADLVQEDDALAESPKRPASGYFHPDIAAKLPKQTLLVEKITEKRKKR
jgi:formate hydrogenlyase subunit 6/NADH:ubiquinone oxidoreductase subunit I